jgi:hypothetical protein
MQFDQTAHQRQADAQPALGARHVAADLSEDVKQRRHGLGRNADTGIGNRQYGLAAFAPGAQGDGTAAGRIFGGVVQQVAHHLHHTCHIHFDR